MSKLSLKDRKILYELDLNARQSDSEIAKKVGLSRDVVRYHIQRLQEEGYINYFMILLNTMKLGFQWYRTFFKFQHTTLEKEREIIELLKTRASWITKVEGKWDLNTGIFCRSVYEYRDFINDFLLNYGASIESYHVSIVTREWTYHRDFFLDRKQKTSTPLLMGIEEHVPYGIEDIDETDYQILNVLMKNARMKTIDLARELRTTEIVVRYRINKLVERGIIIGFKPFLNVNKLGYVYFKLHLTLYNLTPEKKKSMFTYLHIHPNTVHSTELVGGADMETEFQVKSNQEFYQHLKELREKFGDIIRHYEFMQYTDEYKFTYLPEMEFSEKREKIINKK